MDLDWIVTSRAKARARAKTRAKPRTALAQAIVAAQLTGSPLRAGSVYYI